MTPPALGLHCTVLEDRKLSMTLCVQPDMIYRTVQCSKGLVHLLLLSILVHCLLGPWPTCGKEYAALVFALSCKRHTVEL